MKAAPAPFPVIELGEVDSTNSEALRRAALGEVGPLWITARRQTGGRGRLGRSWVTGEGSLAATLLLTPQCPPEKLHQLSFVAGIAAFDAVSRYHQANTANALAPRLKWPNDIMAGLAKLGGILIESTTAGPATVAAIGIGLNVGSAPAIDGRLTASIADWSVTVSTAEVMAALNTAMAAALTVWRNGDGFPVIRQGWLDRSIPVGAPITVNTGRDTLSGAFAGIDETGALLLSSVPAKPDTTRRITHGDVSLHPPRITEG